LKTILRYLSHHFSYCPTYPFFRAVISHERVHAVVALPLSTVIKTRHDPDTSGFLSRSHKHSLIVFLSRWYLCSSPFPVIFLPVEELLFVSLSLSLYSSNVIQTLSLYPAVSCRFFLFLSFVAISLSLSISLFVHVSISLSPSVPLFLALSL